MGHFLCVHGAVAMSAMMAVMMVVMSTLVGAESVACGFSQSGYSFDFSRLQRTAP